MSAESCAQHAPDHVADQDASAFWRTSIPDTSTIQESDDPPESGAFQSGASHQPAAAAGGALLLAGVALAAANMRPAVTSLASVLGEVRDAVGVTTTWASLITSIPTLCFGLAGIGAPLLSRRWGMNRVVGTALALLTTALLLRVTGGPGTVLAGTVTVCAAIAMCNVLIPVVVKQSFPNRVGMATSLYTTAMAAGGSLGSTFTPWLKSITGSWQLALGTWASLALAAFCVWIPATRRLPASPLDQPASRPDQPASRPDQAVQPDSHRVLRRSPLAWAVTLYFGMQSLVAYVVMGWLPEVYKDAGMDSTSAGALLGLLLLLGVPMSMVLPPLVTRTPSQSAWALGMAVLTASGMLGLLYAPMSAPVLWAVLIGVGMSAFPLALVFISLRTRHTADTAQLSAMVQSLGYLIASSGPFLFGALHDLTAGWAASLTAVVMIVAIQGLVGVVAGRPRTV